MNLDTKMRASGTDAIGRTIALLSSDEMELIASNPNLSMDTLDAVTGEKLRRGLMLWRLDCEQDLISMAIFDPNGCGVNAWGDALYKGERAGGTQALLKAIRARLLQKRVARAS